jgi:hypothetical protein
MALFGLLLLLGLLIGLGWLARGRRLRAARAARIHDVLLQLNVSGDTFSPASLQGLPDPATRYLRHALAPGAPLARSVDIHMTGMLRARDDDWVPFEAHGRICAEQGFLWQSRIAVMRRLSVSGVEWLLGDDAGLQYVLAGWWPVLERRSLEFARSAAGRMLTELVWLPSALTPQRGAHWQQGDADRAVVTPNNGSAPLTVVVAEDGGLREASMVRRRLTRDGTVVVSPFGVAVEEEARFGEFKVPVRLAAGWGIGTDDWQDFMRARVDDLRWL